METAWAVPVFEEAEAERRLEALVRGGFFSFRRLFFRRSLRIRIELIYLPCREVLPSADASAASGAILVNGYSRQAQQVRGALASQVRSDDIEFPFLLTEEETLAIARKAFLNWRLSRMSGGAHDSENFVLGRLLLYPFWVRYAETHRRRMTLDLLDGVTGRPGGIMLKQAFLEALKRR